MIPLPQRGLDIAVVGGLTDSKFAAKLDPLVGSAVARSVGIVRTGEGSIAWSEPAKVQAPPGTSGFPRQASRMFGYAWLFMRCLARECDVVVGVYLYPHGLVAWFLARFFGLGCIQVLPGSDLTRLEQGGPGGLAIRDAGAVLVRGRQSAAVVANLGADLDRVFVLNNRFEVPEVAQDEWEKAFDLTYVGYLRQSKRVDLVIGAVSVLRDRGHSIRCQIVGSGPEEDRLRQMVNNAGLENHVEFTGYQTDVYKCLQRGRILILSSDAEGLPMVLVEAMSIGIPVIAPAINDIPDLVQDDQTGMLVRRQSPEAYAEAAWNLLSDAKKLEQISENCRSYMSGLAEKEYTATAIEQVWRLALEKSLAVLQN